MSTEMRARTARARATVGTGLGLTITKLLTNVMRGDLVVRSEVGQGSEFGVKLLNSRPQSLRQLNPDVNIIIEAEILRALEKDPLNRQQRALEFKRELVNGANLS